MCGIVGWWNPNGVATELRPFLYGAALVNQLAHRGPSSQAHKILTNEEDTQTCMLGTARLAIVGKHHGSQPVQSPCGRWWVSMNGEIYNHPTLRRECKGNGVEPGNDSDTAVVAALLSFLPLSCVLERLRGMFALAIFDTHLQEVHLLRDRAGQKPLYWMELPDKTLMWSSEVRVLEKLRRDAGLRLTYNPTAIAQLLCFEYVPAPLTMWKEIQKLQPAQHLHQQVSDRNIRFFWDFPQQTLETGSSRLHWEESLYLALRSATQLRLQADVEVGSLLSGGIDSTTITALASELHPNIRSFSVGIDAPGFSEQSAILENQQTLQTSNALNSTLWTFTRDDFERTLDAVFEHMDEPLADSSLIVTWFLFEQIQKLGVQCVLSGDGADELFAGYPTYQAAHWMQRAPRLPRLGLRATLAPFIQRIPANPNGVSWEEMLKRWTTVNTDRRKPWWKEHQLWMGAWFPSDIQHANGIWDIAEFWSAHCQSDRVGNALFLDQRLYLAEGVLTKVDRASMAHGIEVRSPFLDHHIVELTSQIPLAFKLNMRGNKQILRGLLDSLPKTVQNRKKKGFGSPVAQWMLSKYTRKLDTLPGQLSHWISPTVLNRCILEHREGSHNHRRRLWSAICLSEWMTRHPEQ